MKQIDKSIPWNRNECDELLSNIALKIKEVFPKNDCYFIGSICIDNTARSDIDFVVLLDTTITVTELRMRREQIHNIDSRLHMMLCFIEDEKDLKDTPYISMQSMKDRYIVNRKQFKPSMYAAFKKDLTTQLWKKRKYNKAIQMDKDRKIMRKVSIANKKEYLVEL